LARELGVGKSTGHRILQTLEAHGLAKQDLETERYLITGRLIKMASQIQRNLDFRRVARPFLSALQKRYDETIFIGVLDSTEVVIVDRSDSSEPLRMTHEIGFREPAHSTALGKVLLASLTEQELAAFCQAAEFKAFTGKTLTSPELLRSELKRVRLLGFALDDEETLTGVRCVAAPLRNALGDVVAAVSLSGPSVRLPPERISSLAQDIRAAAESISGELGFNGWGPSPERTAAGAVSGKPRAPSQVDDAREAVPLGAGSRKRRTSPHK
jgi:DNA-binding IclR family transcriptional regulator